MEIWDWAIKWDANILEAIWIPGKDNVIPDSESRWIDFLDWELQNQFFQQLEKQWGPHSIDRMASDKNHKVKRFNSYRWCPGTEAVNCFTENWKGENNYVAPPAHLIMKILRHIQECQAETTIIVPVWKAQPWWPILKEMSMGKINWTERGTTLFKAGPSNQVEYWKDKEWRFRAVRVDFKKLGERMSEKLKEMPE